ncbi:MAG: hypothetical protein WAN41_23250, partial [Candidatus Sulfotelmatobacter sp.]
ASPRWRRYEIARSYSLPLVSGYTRRSVGDENQPKVAENKLVIFSDKDTGRLNVAVDNAFLMKLSNGVHY